MGPAHGLTVETQDPVTDIDHTTPALALSLHNALLGKGHQAVTTAMYGKTKWDPETGEQTVVDVVTYQPECVMPPPDVNSVEWIKGGMKGAKC